MFLKQDGVVLCVITLAFVVAADWSEPAMFPPEIAQKLSDDATIL